MPIKLMVVDDSAFMRSIITDAVECIDGIEVVGIARNGIDALEKIERLDPDIITLDIEMPKLNGIETLKRIKENYKVQVIMLSSVNKIDITFEALELGAIDFITKPENINQNLGEFKKNLEWKIKSLVFPKGKGKEKERKKEKKRKIEEFKPKCNLEPDAIVIAASTGGPRALAYIIENLPSKISIPIFIVQHMPKGFTYSFAERLDKITSIDVVEAKNGMRVSKNKIYLAPGDFHLKLKDGFIQLTDERKLHGVRPAADYLFQTASYKYRENLVGIILTGMGRDGTNGMAHIKKQKGYTIAQDKDSSVVFGMPRTAIVRGVVDEILSLEDISLTINKLLRVK